MFKESKAKLIINDEEFFDWQSYDVESNIESIANSFSFVAANDDGEYTSEFLPGQSVKVMIDDNLIMTGYIDEVEYTTTIDGSTIQITGRDKFSFLVDCSSQLKTFKEINVLQLARELTSEWIDTWTCGITLDKIKRVKVEPGETIIEVLQKWLQKQKLILWSTADGIGVIGRPLYDQDPSYSLFLFNQKFSPDSVPHNNVIESTITLDYRERFSRITVHGTRGNTKENKGKNSRSKAYYDDSGVLTTRNLILSDGKTRSLKEAGNMAAVEVEKRIFDSVAVKYTVAGYYGEILRDGQIENNLYEIDTIVDVEDQMAGLSESMYITRVNFRGDESGQITDLELRRRNLWLDS